MEFEAFPKIGRFKKDCTITEKIDGTNAQICFDPDGSLLVGSRKREIFPNSMEDKHCDNYTFARWVYGNQKALYAFLGEGRHYGEWAGQGIQRNYGLTEKRFYLFNTFRFGPGNQEIPQELAEVGLSVVPVLYQGVFSSTVIDFAMGELKARGSMIAPFMNPEGIIIYHHGIRASFKITFDHDKGKWSAKGEK